MRSGLLVLSALGVIVASSFAASGDAAWKPLEPGALSGGITAELVSEAADQITFEVDIPGFSLGEIQTDHGAFSTLEIEACGRQQSEHADLAVKAFELSQALQERWVRADIAEKRQLLEIICLNLTLENASLVPTMRKPFDIIAEGFSSIDTRGERI